MKQRIKWLLYTLFIHSMATAQTTEEIAKDFPSEEFVYTSYNREIRLFVSDAGPASEMKNTVEMMVLSDKNASRYSRYSIFHSSYDTLTELSAYTKIPSGNKFKTLKVTDTKTIRNPGDNVFYDDLHETVFDFPGLVQHAIAHVDYTQYNKDAHLLSFFYLPSYVAIVNATFTLIVPNDIKINYLVKNDPGNFFTFSEEKKKKETIYKWTVKNAKPVEYYSNAPNYRYFMPHIIFYVTAYTQNNKEEPFFNSIENLYKWNYSFIKDLNTVPDPELKKIVDSLINGITEEKTKAIKIYQWVQNHVRYVAFENGLEGFRPRQAKEICAKRYGDCKDMSSIITQMMRMAGIKAYYTWIGTRTLPYTYTETPLPIVDNHMISTAWINDTWMFFDGTDPNATYDMPPEMIQGKQALVSIDENQYKILTVPVQPAEKSTITDSTFINISETGINGYESVSYDGYFGKDVYSSLLYRDENSAKEYVNKRMSKGSNKFILGKYNINKVSPENNIAVISADFNIPGYSKKAGNEYYINLNLEKLLENTVIDTAKRKVPIENFFLYSLNQYHILNIPDGYQVSYLPANYRFENDLVQINMYYKTENRKVIAAQEVKIKKLLVMPSDFAEWNKPMKALQSYYKEVVVLEKK